MVAAEKVVEVAQVYKAYQEALDREHLLDFGDLIAKSVSLLRTHADVRDTLRSTYRHVLVDEYQDVNRASGLFLKELAGCRGRFVGGWGQATGNLPVPRCCSGQHAAIWGRLSWSESRVS